MRARAARRPPAGYAHFRLGGVEVVALAELARTVREALVAADGTRTTLHEYAAHHRLARPLAGRGVAYAVPLPDAVTHVVVRHSRHGGLLAPLTGDRFLPPTRAPRELAAALRLAAAGVRTPELVAFAVYPAGPLLRRSDVATREVPRGRDLAARLVAPPDPDAKRAILRATAGLLASLQAAGARHPDLNLKNVLLSREPDGRFEAWVLDVDRVVFGAPAADAVGRANLARLARSARKWRERYGADITEEDLRWLADAAAGSGAGG